VIRKALSFDPEDRYADAGAFASMLEQARREMGDAPLPPYVPAAAPLPPRQPLLPHDERTEFLDDRTLLDPSVERVPARAAAPAPTPPPPAERQPYPLPPRRYEEPRSGMGTFLMALVALLLLGAGAVFAWWIMEGQRPATVADVPPPPEEVEIVIPDEEPEEAPPPLAVEARIQNEEGQRYYRDGNFDEARRHFQQAVQMMPDSATYRYNFGLALLRLGEERQASREFQRVLQQEPQRAGAHFYLGESSLALGDTASAIASMEAAQQFATDPRERNVVERRLREVRTAVLQPPAQPAAPGPEIDIPPLLDDQAGAASAPARGT
jgi:tetratricopeptide (TPR) repeat protein